MQGPRPDPTGRRLPGPANYARVGVMTAPELGAAAATLCLLAAGEEARPRCCGSSESPAAAARGAPRLGVTRVASLVSPRMSRCAGGHNWEVNTGRAPSQRAKPYGESVPESVIQRRNPPAFHPGAAPCFSRPAGRRRLAGSAGSSAASAPHAVGVDGRPGWAPAGTLSAERQLRAAYKAARPGCLGTRPGTRAAHLPTTQGHRHRRPRGPVIGTATQTPTKGAGRSVCAGPSGVVGCGREFATSFSRRISERAQPSRPLPRRAAGQVRAGILCLPRALGRPKAGRLRPQRRLRGCAAWSGRGVGEGLEGVERGNGRPRERGERPRGKGHWGRQGTRWKERGASRIRRERIDAYCYGTGEHLLIFSRHTAGHIGRPTAAECRCCIQPAAGKEVAASASADASGYKPSQANPCPLMSSTRRLAILSMSWRRQIFGAMRKSWRGRPLPGSVLLIQW